MSLCGTHYGCSPFPLDTYRSLLILGGLGAGRTGASMKPMVQDDDIPTLNLEDTIPRVGPTTESSGIRCQVWFEPEGAVVTDEAL